MDFKKKKKKKKKGLRRFQELYHDGYVTLHSLGYLSLSTLFDFSDRTETGDNEVDELNGNERDFNLDKKICRVNKTLLRGEN